MKDAERNRTSCASTPVRLSEARRADRRFLVRDTGAREQLPPDRAGHALPLRAGHAVNDNYDGRFRNVRVKVRRGGRSSPAGATSSAPARRTRCSPRGAAIALDRTGPRPEAFPFKGLALTFPQAGPTTKVPVLVRIPGRSLKYAPTPAQKDVMAADLAVVVRVRNEYQQEVSRVSQRFSSPAPPRLEAARAGDISSTRDRAAPGQYMLDAVAYGRRRRSQRQELLEVPLPGLGAFSAASWSSTTSSGCRPPTATLEPPTSGTLVYPSLGDPLRKSTAKAMGFYFTARGPATARKGLLEVVRDGQVTALFPMDLPAPDATGRIQHAGTLPLHTLTPGSYELRLTLLAGAERPPQGGGLHGRGVTPSGDTACPVPRIPAVAVPFASPTTERLIDATPDPSLPGRPRPSASTPLSLRLGGEPGAPAHLQARSGGGPWTGGADKAGNPVTGPARRTSPSSTRASRRPW
jgi:hypothetical protein